MGIRSGDLNYALIPLGHSYGLGNLALPLIARGVPLVCGSAPLPHAIFRDFVRWRPRFFPACRRSGAPWPCPGRAGVAGKPAAGDFRRRAAFP